MKHDHIHSISQLDHMFFHVSLPTSCLLLFFFFLITHSVQLCMAVGLSVGAWETNHWEHSQKVMILPPSATINYQKCLNSEWVPLCINKTKKIASLILCRSYAGNHCRCSSMRAMVMSYPKDILSQITTLLSIFMLLHVFVLSVCFASSSVTSPKPLSGVVVDKDIPFRNFDQLCISVLTPTCIWLCPVK